MLLCPWVHYGRTIGINVTDHITQELDFLVLSALYPVLKLNWRSIILKYFKKVLTRTVDYWLNSRNIARFVSYKRWLVNLKDGCNNMFTWWKFSKVYMEPFAGQSLGQKVPCQLCMSDQLFTASCLQSACSKGFLTDCFLKMAIL